jgi:hypothetical protein
MFMQTIKAALSATRMLFGRWSTLVLVITLYAGLLLAGYLFVSTREATISQLIITLAVIVVAPMLFFALQAVALNYTSESPALLKKLVYDAVRLGAVSVPMIVLTALALYGLGKIHWHPTVTGAVRYLLIGVVAPLFTIQLWIAASRDGLRPLVRRLHRVAFSAFAPQSVVVYTCGVVVFAIAPYLLIFHPTQTNRVWLEFSLLAVRLIVSALLILVGWFTTVGTLSILSRSGSCLPDGRDLARVEDEKKLWKGVAQHSYDGGLTAR